MGPALEVPPREVAAAIISALGSRPVAWVKWAARARVALPGPQPRSSRELREPPVWVWRVRISSMRALG